QPQHPAKPLVDLWQQNFESCDDAEIAPTAADGPEQIWVRAAVDLLDGAVRGHYLSRDQVVNRKAELAREVATPAPQGQPADSNRWSVAEACGEPVGMCHIGVLPRRDPAPSPRRPLLSIDRDPSQAAEGHYE